MKNYNVTAYVLLKTEFKQPTKDIYKLAKITEDFCKESIDDARKKSIKFRNWFDKNIYVLPGFRNEKGITKMKCTPKVGQIKFNFRRCIFYV